MYTHHPITCSVCVCVCVCVLVCVCVCVCVLVCVCIISLCKVYVLQHACGLHTHRMEGRGVFTDSKGRQWVGQFFGKNTDQLRLRLK